MGGTARPLDRTSSRTRIAGPCCGGELWLVRENYVVAAPLEKVCPPLLLTLVDLEPIVVDVSYVVTC